MKIRESLEELEEGERFYLPLSAQVGDCAQTFKYTGYIKITKEILDKRKELEHNAESRPFS